MQKKYDTIWQPIEMQGNVVTHAVSPDGDVKVLAHTVLKNDGKFLFVQEKILKPFETTQGYLAVDLPSGKSKKVHRLVAKAFIPNPRKVTQVNHKDGNVKNNHMTNLEWVTPKENTNHAIDSNLRPREKKCKPVAQYDMEDNFIQSYRSVLDASSITGINKRSIANCASGKRNRAGEFKWVYV